MKYINNTLNLEAGREYVQQMEKEIAEKFKSKEKKERNIQISVLTSSIR